MPRLKALLDEADWTFIGLVISIVVPVLLYVFGIIPGATAILLWILMTVLLSYIPSFFDRDDDAKGFSLDEADWTLIGLMISIVVPDLLYIFGIIPGVTAIFLWLLMTFLVSYIVSFFDRDDDAEGFPEITAMLIILVIIGVVVYFWPKPECDGRIIKLDHVTFNEYKCVPD